MTLPSRPDSQPADERRWTLICDDPAYALPIDVDGPELAEGERVVVMPVSEAEAALAAARQVDEALTDRLWCAIDDQLPIGESPPSMNILRAALLAALNVEGR
jgi:hypothetical protein